MCCYLNIHFQGQRVNIRPQDSQQPRTGPAQIMIYCIISNITLKVLMPSYIWHRVYVQRATRDTQTVHLSKQKTKKVLRSTLSLLCRSTRLSTFLSHKAVSTPFIVHCTRNIAYRQKTAILSEFCER